VTVLYAHGLEGRPDGRKARTLRAAGIEVVAPDGRSLPLAERIAHLERALAGLDRPVLVGSSYGGLAALVLAARHPNAVRGLVLCAPALIWREPPVTDPDALVVDPGLPCTVLHGLRDDVVPVAASRRLVERSPHVQLVERDDDHRLTDSLDLLLATVQSHLGVSPRKT
jgi:pimeloyl-ACP methyl ester carboxylesterase